MPAKQRSRQCQASKPLVPTSGNVTHRQQTNNGIASYPPTTRHRQEERSADLLLGQFRLNHEPHDFLEKFCHTVSRVLLRSSCLKSPLCSPTALAANCLLRRNQEPKQCHQALCNPTKHRSQPSNETKQRSKTERSAFEYFQQNKIQLHAALRWGNTVRSKSAQLPIPNQAVGYISYFTATIKCSDIPPASLI